MKWSYGVTTVPQRLGDLLPKTLESLKQAGFDKPRLFIDGASGNDAYEQKFPDLEKTYHYPTIRTYGNWFLALLELYIREPESDYFALFQDDLLTYKNLREYLEKSNMPKDGYINLSTHLRNYELCKTEGHAKGWFASNQMGYGAIGLVFTREMVWLLCAASKWMERPLDKQHGYQGIDGGIVHSLSYRHYGKHKEYCHNPTLLFHTGTKSTIQGVHQHQPTIDGFLGEDYDALELLAGYVDPATTPISIALNSNAARTLVPAPKKQEPDPPDNTPDDIFFASPWALGEHVKKALDIVGLDQSRIRRWLGAFCNGCEERRQRLNRLGWWAKQLLSGEKKAEEMKARFNEMLGDDDA